MSKRTKNILYSSVLLVAVLVVWITRNQPGKDPVYLDGETMGTTYHVTYYDAGGRSFKKQLDSLLVLVNKAISNYDSSSEVSRFNQSKKGVRIESTYFRETLNMAAQVYKESGRAFDPTVLPLVNAWGFGPAGDAIPDSSKIDSLVSLVGFYKVRVVNDSVLKSDPRVQVDFGGIGQGIGADVMADFLRTRGISNFLVELGGEGVAAGKNLKEGRAWQVGILDPDSDPVQLSFYAELGLHDQAFSTSGNYFNYRVVNGRKFAHTIDPSTGYPVESPLLSATVLSANCTAADAWATALMVMGHEQGAEAARRAHLEILLIYSESNGTMSHYFSERISGQIKLLNP